MTAITLTVGAALFFAGYVVGLIAMSTANKEPRS